MTTVPPDPEVDLPDPDDLAEQLQALADDDQQDGCSALEDQTEYDDELTASLRPLFPDGVPVDYPPLEG